MADFINFAGIQVAMKDVLLYADWFLLFSMVFIVYAAYSTGKAREKKEERRAKEAQSKEIATKEAAAEPVPVSEKKERTTTPSKKSEAPVEKVATAKKDRSTTPAKKRSSTPSKRAAQESTTTLTATAPTPTPKKRAAKKAVEDLGHLMSPEGRRSVRLRNRDDNEE